MTTSLNFDIIFSSKRKEHKKEMLHVVIITDRYNDDIEECKVFKSLKRARLYIRERMCDKVKNTYRSIDDIVIEDGWYSSDDERYDVYYYEKELE